jgi:tripartite-type tricarboxylate transporter receptor subunit TctC
MRSGRKAMVRRLVVAAIAAALLASGGATAQPSFPTRPVHIYVPYPAGGGVDVLTRTLGDIV